MQHCNTSVVFHCHTISAQGHSGVTTYLKVISAVDSMPLRAGLPVIKEITEIVTAAEAASIYKNLFDPELIKRLILYVIR